MSRKFGALLEKELREHFFSSVGYLLIAAFSLFCSIWLFTVVDFFAVGRASLRPLFAMMPYALAVVAAVAGVRSWSGERRGGTVETLLSFPVPETSLVLAKFSASYLVVCCSIVATLPMVLLLTPFGEFDAGELAASYIGIFLYASTAVAVGQLTSSLSRSQISSFVVSLLLLLVLNLLGAVAESLGGARTVQLLRYAALTIRLEEFNRGLVDTADIAFFVTTTAVLLHFTGAVIRSRRRL